MANPTYYGPVATGGSDATTIDTQTTGSLAVAVQQPSNLYQANKDEITYTEIWKVPTSQATKLTNGGYSILGINFVVGYRRPTTITAPKFISRFSPPAVPQNYDWWISSVSLDECDAGDHSLVTIAYRMQYVTEQDDPRNGDMLEEQDYWEVEWVPYQMNVLAYCKNEGKPPHWKRFIPGVFDDKMKPTGGDLPSTFAEATYIKECANRTTYQQKYGNLTPYEWVRCQSVYELNDSEKRIFSYYINNMNPELHHPVLTHHSVRRQPKLGYKYRDIQGNITHVKYHTETDIGAGIDQVYVQSELLENQHCPYDFDEEWEWRKTADKMVEHNQKGTTYYERIEQWTGAKKWCGNFYEGGSYYIDPKDKTLWKIGEQ